MSQDINYHLNHADKPEDREPTWLERLMALDETAREVAAKQLYYDKTLAPTAEQTQRLNEFFLNARVEFIGLKHGLCSRKLILPNECPEEFDQLCTRWLAEYDNPAEGSALRDFVLKTVVAEWERIRCQRWYDLFLTQVEGRAPLDWTPGEIKRHDLSLRYKTAAERAFQRAYKMADSHYKAALQRLERSEIRRGALEKKRVSAEKVAAEAEAAQDEADCKEALAERYTHFCFINAETGERTMLDGRILPPLPDFVPRKIIPGQYGPTDPSNFNRTFREQWFAERRKQRELAKQRPQQPAEEAA